MKKKILSFTLALLMMFFATPTILLSFAAEGIAELLDNAPKISITPEKEKALSGGAAEPDASGNVNFIIKADPAPEADITVSYKTADLSALAAAGDYEAAEGTVVLTPEKPMATVTVKTSKAEYAIITHDGSKENKESRYDSLRFEVMITDVEGNDGKWDIDSEKDRAECVLNAENTLRAQTENSRKVFQPYMSAYDCELTGALNTPPVASNTIYRKTFSSNLPWEWNQYRDSGVDAKIYMGIMNSFVFEGSRNNAAPSSTMLGGLLQLIMTGPFYSYEYEYFGWGAAFVYAHTGYTGEEDEYEDAYENNFGGLSWATHDGSRVTTVFRSGINLQNSMSFEKLLEKNYVIVRENGASKTSDGVYDQNNYFISVDERNVGSSINMNFTPGGLSTRRISGGDVVFRLEDISAPKVGYKDGVQEIYHNFETATVGEKLKLAIRFNEPVQVLGKNPYITGKINGKGTSFAPDPYAIKFEYVGGSMTDTLYFEADYSGEYLVTSITNMTFGNASSIQDFAGVANTVSLEPFSITGFVMDRRDPIISISSADLYGNSENVRSASVEIVVGQISSGTTLKYAWTNSTDTPSGYDAEMLLDNVSVNGTQNVVINGGGDGKKHLHVKVETIYGKSTITFRDSKTGVSRNYAGAFYFDNSAPTFPKDVELVEAETNMKQKVYKIPLPTDTIDGAGSGFRDLKIYYSFEGDAGVTLLEREKVAAAHGYERYDVNSFISTDFSGSADNQYLTLTIEAEDLGIEEKSRKENVTIYFSLTDNIGNTDYAVKHVVDFDRREYIDVADAGATGAFAGKTERIEGENTFVYGSDANVAQSGLYYSFKLDILEDSTDCQHAFSIIRTDMSGGEGVEITSGFNVKSSVTSATGIKSLTIEFTSPLEAGRYDVQLLCYESERDPELDVPDRVSPVHTVYIGNGVSALGNKINTGTMLINKVYQLPATSTFYYMGRPDSENAAEIVDTVLTEYYNEQKLPMSFSSFEAARKYVLFNEYRDLCTVVLTEELAEVLNNKTSAVRPAQGEKTVAKAGQVWIRYKSLSWSLGSKQTSNWVYYYYGTTDVLNPDYFSSTLNEALNYVANLVALSGKTVSLTDSSLRTGSGATYVDKYGVPYLDPTQTVSTDLHLSDSKTVISKFSGDITYVADTAIYSSNVVKNDGSIMNEYVLLGHLEIPTTSRYQYRRYKTVGFDYVSEEWSNILLDPNSTVKQRFGDVILADGWYEIRELGGGGVALYDVYIDKESPTVYVSWKDSDGNVLSQSINQSSEKEFRARNFEIVGIDLEYDKYAYVALYTVYNSELYGVYTLSELQKATVQLPDGKYYMVVADRSGNTYSLSLQINSSQFNCDVEETRNVRIKFTCDRDPSYIQTFFVKRNGTRVENVQYQTTLTFTESGIYEFYVEDIYGNAKEIKHDFKREYPKVDWSYIGSDGYFTKYDENKDSGVFSLTKISDGTYRINSSVQVRFHITGDYVYEFIGTPPTGVSKNDVYNYVTITTLESFQLKISYRSHPNVYTVYNCTSDVIAPLIKVSAEVDSATPSELDIFRQEILDAIAGGKSIGTEGTIIEDGKEINVNFLDPKTIAYYVNKKQTNYLSSGDTVLSDFIRVSATDESGVAKIEIYLNESLIKSETSESGFSDIVLSKSGEYRIVAVDTLGNRSEFTFKNSSPDPFKYFVDEREIELGLHNYKNFDKNLNYTDVKYGQSYVSFVMDENMSVSYMITDSKKNKTLLMLEVSDGVVYSVRYFVREGSVTPELAIIDVLFNGNDAALIKDNEYPVFEAEDFAVLAKIDSLGKVTLTARSKVADPITVEARLSTPDEEYYYNKTELSSICADLAFNVDGEFITPENSVQLNINSAFSIATDPEDDERIVLIEVYFSVFNDLDGADLIGRENIYGRSDYSDQGFYLVRVTDRYGNSKTYRIHYSTEFDVTSYTELRDKEKFHYSAVYEGILYSNFKVVFEIHSIGATVVVTKDGKAYSVDVVENGGICYVTLSENGSYTLTFTDLHGNTVHREASIDSRTLSFNEELLTGYNENALRKDEGYTNQKLSVVESVLKSENISYLAISYGSSVTVILDKINEDFISLDATLLRECIGNDGDGEYTVTVRNRYGSVATKVIKYRATPTLTLERETRSNTKLESYSISDALTIGFWSNSKLSFKTDALVYEFTVNGDRTECPRIITFSSSEQYGWSEYDISYVDEYGFSYTFKAYLVRRNLDIKVGDNLNAQYVNDVLTTKENVYVVFTDGATCVYTLNNSEERLYTPGEKLSMDGVYRFTVVDHAGNAAAITIKKDTSVEFYLKSNSSSSIKNGAVVNDAKVDFIVYNDDSAYIEKVLRNGEVQEDFSGSTFLGDGKWEIIVADKLGNRAYFSFYIITLEKNGFVYTTPYEYHITELWFNDESGVKVSYMQFVDQNDFTSSFDFIENGRYVVSMMSDVTGVTSTFEFTINTMAPNVSLVGCREGETTINDVTIDGCKVGDRIMIYKATKSGEKLVKVVEVSSVATPIPTITDGGEYRVVVESEAGVATEFNFVRKHVMNTSGSIFIMILVGVASVGLFAGLVYRNKSKTDD